MRSFTTEGPVVSTEHYCIPSLERIDLGRVLELIRHKKYFFLHAPRQSGKTSVLRTLQELLNSGAEGDYRCVHVNVEDAQTARGDVGRAVRTVLGRLGSRARLVLGDGFVSEARTKILGSFTPHEALEEALIQWAQADPRPLVLLVDEIDALVGDSLLSVLRQLRSGYELRPSAFPHSIVLCGVRDLRDYRIHSSSAGHPVTGGSAFNISAASLRLGDFSESEVDALMMQHTTESGQRFLPEAVKRVWAQTLGQPWLVNALCRRACFDSERGRNRDHPITDDQIMEAREQFIMERVTHIDQLAHKLEEGRVRRVIEPLLTGDTMPDFSTHDYEYVRDLGLIAPDDPVRIANPIYDEVIPRELTFNAQKALSQQAAWYIDSERGLLLRKLLEAFQQYYRQESECWAQISDYKEAGPQLLLHAFLQRVVNGGGRIQREHALGRGRADLLVRWPHQGGMQRFVIECKVLRDGLESTIRKGLEQTAGYMDRCAALEGHLVIFDRGQRPWGDKVFHKSESVSGKPIEIWGM